MKVNLLKIIIFLSEIYLIMARKPTVKKWLPNSDFESIENWSPNGVPCESQRIIYSDILDEEIFLTKKDIIAREIILPRTGSLKLATNSKIQLSSDNFQYKNCPGGDITFKENVIENWMLSKNWKDLNSKEQNQAIPHNERLPCQDDEVVFENGKSYEIMMPRNLQYVKGIGDGVKKFVSNDEWKEEIEENSLIYHEWEDAVTPSVRIASRSLTCSLTESCPCQKYRSFLELCMNEMAKCPPVMCLKPVQPLNHCCKICGAVLNTFEKKGFDVKDLRMKIQNKIDEWKVDGIDWHIGVVGEVKDMYQIQVVVVEKSLYDGRSVELAKRLQEQFIKSVNFTKQMNLAGIPWDPTRSGGWEILIMFFVVATFFIALLLYHYSPSAIVSARPFGPLGFARFENRSREGSLMLAVSHLSLNKAFDNPMYDTVATKSEEKTELKEEPLNDSDTEEEPVSEEAN